MLNLEHTCDVLIAKDLGVNPEDVSLEFIRHWRALIHEPLDHATEYGGRISEGLQDLNHSQITEALREFDSI